MGETMVTVIALGFCIGLLIHWLDSKYVQSGFSFLQKIGVGVAAVALVNAYIQWGHFQDSVRALH